MCFTRNKRISQPLNLCAVWKDILLCPVSLGVHARNKALETQWWGCVWSLLLRTISCYLPGFQNQARHGRSDSGKQSGIPHHLDSVLVQHQQRTQPRGRVQHFRSESGTGFHFLVIKRRKWYKINVAGRVFKILKKKLCKINW